MNDVINASIDSIKPYKNNAKKHSDKQINQLVESIKKFGLTKPLEVDESYVLLAGHGRFEAIKKLGYTEVPVKIISGWSEEEKKAYRLIDNKTNESKWDNDKLSHELKDISAGTQDFDMGVYDFGTSDIDFYDAFNDTSGGMAYTSSNRNKLILSIGRHKITLDDPGGKLLEASKYISDERSNEILSLITMILDVNDNEISD